MRMPSNRDYIADAGAETVLVECRHCGARFLRTTVAAAKSAAVAHLLAVHPGKHRATDRRRDRSRR